MMLHTLGNISFMITNSYASITFQFIINIYILEWENAYHRRNAACCYAHHPSLLEGVYFRAR